MAPVLYWRAYIVGPRPMTLYFLPGVVVMIMLSTITASRFPTQAERVFVGVLTLGVYFTFAITHVSASAPLTVKWKTLETRYRD